LAKLEGTFVVNVTPFDSSDQVDTSAMRGIVDYFLDNKVDGIFVGGSTGEFAYLTPEEHMKIIEIVVTHVGKRVPVLAGTAACATKQAVAFTRYAETVGADGAVIVPPFYHKPTEEGIINHYREISEAVDFPIMVYNNPATAKIDLQPELIKKLAEFDNIRYVKESSGDVSRVWKIRKATNDKMTVFCGADNLMLESYLMGATGFICVAANFLPFEASEVYRLYKQGKIQEAKTLYEKLLPVLNFLEDTGKFAQASKAALNMSGKKVGLTRSPLMPLNSGEEQHLRELLSQIKSN
jgi:4-hydroxy-tetrahydrodipicolinate synthase